MGQSAQIALLPESLANAVVGDAFELSIPANFQYLSIISTTLAEILKGMAQIAEPETTIYNIQLAVHENCTNIVEHAYADLPAGQLRLHLQLITDPLALVINLFDSGHTFDPADVAPPDFDGLQERGLGLFLLYELMDDVQYFPQQGNNRWQLTKYLPINDE